MFVLLITTVIVPYRLAFVDIESTEWVITYYVIDSLFLIDIILWFFTSYTDTYKQIEVVQHKLIAKNYL